MITITITKTTKTTWNEKVNQITSKTPTQHKDKYEGVTYDEKYAVAEVTKTEDKRVTLLEQNILDDAELDLAAVIIAINKLK